MKTLLPTSLLSLLHLALPALSHASPQPALVGSDWEISLIPRHTLFLRQLNDLQTFTQALGGARASAITNSGDPQRPFSVDGQTFDSFESAAQRSCDNQFQACQGAANGNGNGNGNNNNGNNNNNNNRNNANANGNNGGNGGNRNKERVKERRDDGEQRGRIDKRSPEPQQNNNNNNNNNNGGGSGGGLTVQQCDQQKNQCNSFQQTARVQNFETGLPSVNIGPDPNPQFADFDLICES